MQIDSLSIEQSVWQRKLIESLIALISFQDTNQNVYFYHYFLLNDYNHYISLRKEQRDFFHGTCSIREKAIEDIKQKIVDVEKQLPSLAACWYLASKPKSISQHKDGQLVALKSFRQKLLNALQRATAQEKLAIGYTYDMAFAEKSRNIHFDLIGSYFHEPMDRFSLGSAQSFILIDSIFRRTQTISGKKAPKLSNAINNSKIPEQDPSLISGIAKVGDFVFAAGPYLGEVPEVKQSPFGYESYRIRYLDEPPVENIIEDWLPAFVFISMNQKRRNVKDCFCGKKCSR